MNCKELVFSRHAIQRMFERSISRDTVVSTVYAGECIDTYPEDRPYPSVLLLGWSEDQPIHLVLAQNAMTEQCIVVTVYIPTEEQWLSDFTKRKKL